MIEELLFEKIEEEIIIARKQKFTSNGHSNSKEDFAYRCGLSEALRLVKKVLQIEED